MGNKPAERKRKKKGRPSLLDLQKRSLRLQKLHQQQTQNPSPCPTAAAGRRNPDPGACSDDDSPNGKRREKKLKHVLHIPNSATPASESGDGDARKGEGNNSSKRTDDALRGRLSDLGPTTPLPDKKLLEFILDRLQKKDTYGVFSEPVDPEELPDYHEIIEHPMDFATVRKKLANGAYACLEQFEEDVLLISSNAMQYNSPDTIYYRQARAIQELAKKNFENLRQESDDNEPEPEPKPVVRRGRPPSKTIKRSLEKPPVDLTASDLSSSGKLAIAGAGTYWSNLSRDISRKGLASDRPLIGAAATRPYNLRPIEPFSWSLAHKLESSEEYSGFGSKGNSSKSVKGFPLMDENRRNTYNQPQASTSVHEPATLTSLDEERKRLVTVGVHIEYTYARSLARFAANLGPVGWDIAAKRIERVLPPGAKFGRGWIGESEAPRPLPSQPPKPSESTSHASSSDLYVSNCTPVPQGDKPSPKDQGSQPPCTAALSTRSELEDVAVEPSEDANHGHSKATLMGFANGYTAVGVLNRQMSHSRALDMVSRANIDGSSRFCQQTPMRQLGVERAKLMSNFIVNSSNSLPVLTNHQNLEAASLQVKSMPLPPDLNMMVDSQQPDLALQL